MTEVMLPKGVDQETYDKAKALIIEGFENEQEPDAIKSVLFGSGIAFSKLQNIYKAVTVNESLVFSAEELNSKLDALITGQDFSFKEDYPTMEGIMESFIKEVKGLTRMRVTKRIRAFFASNDQKFPRKTAPSRGRMGKVNRCVIDYFAKTEAEELSVAGLTDALMKKDFDEDKATAYAKQHYRVAFALASGLTANKALTQLAQD